MFRLAGMACALPAQPALLLRFPDICSPLVLRWRAALALLVCLAGCGWRIWPGVLGVRALSVEEDAARKAHGVIAHDARQLMRDDTHVITLPENFPENVYITFDLDGLDPSVLPSTGTPVPGGLGFYQALDLVESAARGRCVKGIDVVELAPVPGQPVSDFTAALISYHLMRIALVS